MRFAAVLGRIPRVHLQNRSALKTPSLPCQSVCQAGLIREQTSNMVKSITGYFTETPARAFSLIGYSEQRDFSVAKNLEIRRSRMIAPVLVAVFAAMMLLCSGTMPAKAQGVIKSTHGDWQIRCETPAGAQNEQCALIQSVVAEDRANAPLTVIILKTADHKNKLLRVIVPMGVLLPSGLGLKLDDKDVGRAGFVRCLPTGCVAEVVMSDDLLNQLKNAKTATFIIFETPEEGIGFPLSLKGLAEGYDKLP